MRDSDLIEHRALRHKTESFVEGQGVSLGVQVDPLQSPARRFLDEPSKYPSAHPESPVGGQYSDAANLTEGLQPPRANCVTVRRARQGMNADGVRGIPFFMFGNPLLLDEDRPPQAHEFGAITVPGGGPDGARIDGWQSDFSRQVGRETGVVRRREGFDAQLFSCR